jgi:phosphoesterase RecJ-like protein
MSVTQTQHTIPKELTQKFDQANAAIQKAKRIALLAHMRPDEDAIAAQLAMHEYVTEQLHKEADIICDENHRDRSTIFPHFNKIISKDSLEEYDLIIVHDAGEVAIVYPNTGFLKAKAAGIPVIKFDHHVGEGNDEYGTIEAVDASVCDATSHLLYYFFTYVGAEITRNMATCLMAGLMYDTGKFMHANTNASVFEVAGKLLEKGAPLPKIANTIFNKRSFPALQLWGRALERVKVNPKTRMALSVITKKDLDETGASVEELSGLITIINSIEGSRFALLLTEEAANKIKGSLRSEDYKGVDVSRIARLLGGGGHKLSSGFVIHGSIGKSENEQWLVQ